MLDLLGTGDEPGPPAEHAHHGGDGAARGERRHRRQPSHHLDGARIESDLLRCFATRSLFGGLPLVHPTPGEAHLAAMRP